MANLQHIFPGGFTAAITSTELVDPIPAFQAHCKAAGLVVEAIVDDGEIHRVPTMSSKRGALDGWYILHTSGKFPVGVCGDWRTDVQHKWAAQTGRQLTFQERADHAKWIEEVKAKQAAVRAAAQAEAAERADAEVGGYADASAEHPYLQRKQVQPHGIKIDRAGKLVVPIYNADGEIISHQTIDADGNKRFLKGGRVEGGFFEIRGTRGVVFIGEGFATCASVHEATGATVLVAFDAGNLPRVAKVAKALYVGSKLVMAADNDQFTDNNPGMRAASTAAHAVHGLVVHPEFSPAEVLAGKPTDFNDLHVLRGLDAVRDRIEMVTAPVREGLGFKFSKIGRIELKPIEWVVDDYVEADSLCQVFGDPGSGKSFVAIDLACCIATGRAWHGHDVRQGAVFYIAGEGHNGLARRFRAWELGNDADISDAPIYKSHRAAQLYDATEAALVAQSIKEMILDAGCEPSLIVIDTLARNMGGDENSTQDMNAFIQHLDIYMRQPYKCCVMLVHHSGTADKERGRGSSTVRGAIDAEYKVSIDEGTKTVQVEAKKMKDADKPATLNFGLTQIDLPVLDKHGEAVKGAYLTAVDISGLVKKVQRGAFLSANQRKCLDCLIGMELKRVKDCIADSVGYDEWRDSAKEHGISSKRFAEIVPALLKKKMVGEDSNGFRTCSDEPK